MDPIRAKSPPSARRQSPAPLPLRGPTKGIPNLPSYAHPLIGESALSLPSQSNAAFFVKNEMRNMTAFSKLPQHQLHAVVSNGEALSRASSAAGSADEYSATNAEAAHAHLLAQAVVNPDLKQHLQNLLLSAVQQQQNSPFSPTTTASSSGFGSAPSTGFPSTPPVNGANFNGGPFSPLTSSPSPSLSGFTELLNGHSEIVRFRQWIDFQKQKAVFLWKSMKSSNERKFFCQIEIFGQ